ILELEFRNLVVPAARPIGAVRLFAPPLQGRETHTQRARNFALQLPLRRQAICLRQLRRDFHPRVPAPFLLSHSSLPRSRYEHLVLTTNPSIAVFWTKLACTHKRDIGLNIRPWQTTGLWKGQKPHLGATGGFCVRYAEEPLSLLLPPI